MIHLNKMKIIMGLILLALIIMMVGVMISYAMKDPEGRSSYRNDKVVVKNVAVLIKDPALSIIYKNIIQHNSIIDVDTSSTSSTSSISKLCLIEFIGKYKNTVKSFKFFEKTQCSNINFDNDFQTNWPFKHGNQIDYFNVSYWLNYE